MSERQMISFDGAGGRFSFRAAGIALRRGHVLVHRAHGDTHWSLPGGRVEVGEASALALTREMEEELGVVADIGPLRFVMENFFSYDDTRFHELGFYYAMVLPESFPFPDDGGVCHECVDGDARLEFKWVKADGPLLAGIDFQPAKLRALLVGTSDEPVHIIHDERSP